VIDSAAKFLLLQDKNTGIVFGVVDFFLGSYQQNTVFFDEFGMAHRNTLQVQVEISGVGGKACTLNGNPVRTGAVIPMLSMAV
jgi:hypothetical protein